MAHTAEYQRVSYQTPVGESPRFSASSYCLLSLAIITDLIWIVVVLTWAYEINNGLHYLPPSMSETTAEGWAASALILWAVLMLCLLILTGMILILAAHRLVIGGPRPVYASSGVRSCEMCVVVILLIGIIISAGWVLGLYIYMYVNCGTFLFCCTTAPDSTCAMADMQVSFQVQFWMAVIGTAFALVAGIWAAVLAGQDPGKNEPDMNADY